ncbi:MAG: acyl carrier protein [Bacteroidales bacterium]|nr:acyl carrier protein [Bacteroidales bacterium]
MTREELEKRIFSLITDKLGINEEEITLTADFRRDLSADSLDISELVMNLENDFSIVIPESEMINLKTVGDVVDYIEKALAD